MKIIILSNKNQNKMKNLSIKIDLLKLKHAGITNLINKKKEKIKCLVIKLDNEDLYIGEKGIYLNLTWYEVEESKFNQTHILKINYDKDFFDKMSEEEKKNTPIIGNIKEIKKKEIETTLKDIINVEEDLPF